MRRNVISIVISIMTLVISIAAMVSSHGLGMEGLRTTFSLIIYGGIALTVAFVFALTAMMHGEEPLILTLMAFALPPLLAFIAIIRH